MIFENNSNHAVLEVICGMLRNPMPMDLQLQNYLYDSLIGTQPLKTRQDVYEMAAEVYHYQILLNKKVGKRKGGNLCKSHCNLLEMLLVIPRPTAISYPMSTMK